MPLFNNDETDATFCVASFFLPFGRFALSATEAALWQLSGYTDAQQAAIESDLAEFMSAMSKPVAFSVLSGNHGQVIVYDRVTGWEKIPHGHLTHAYPANSRNKSSLYMQTDTPVKVAYWGAEGMVVEWWDVNGVQVTSNDGQGVIDAYPKENYVDVSFFKAALPYVTSPISLLITEL